jgi:hypothetical protein
LPDHLLVAIFSCFTNIDIVGKLLPVSRRWYRLAYSTKKLWKQIQFNVDQMTKNQLDSMTLLLSKVFIDEVI